MINTFENLHKIDFNQMKGGGKSIFIGIFLIVILVAVGAYFFIYKKENNVDTSQITQSDNQSVSESINQTQTQSNSYKKCDLFDHCKELSEIDDLNTCVTSLNKLGCPEESNEIEQKIKKNYQTSNSF